MNKKQKAILLGYKVKHRPSIKRDEKPIYGVSQLRACWGIWKECNPLLEDILGGLGISVSLFKGQLNKL